MSTNSINFDILSIKVPNEYIHPRQNLKEQVNVSR